MYCSSRRHLNIPSPMTHLCFRSRFRYGKDKTPWFYELLHSSLQVPLVTLRDVFTVHLGHATTPARRRFTGVTQSTGGLSEYVKTSKLTQPEACGQLLVSPTRSIQLSSGIQLSKQRHLISHTLIAFNFVPGTTISGSRCSSSRRPRPRSICDCR